ncbi:Transposase DDE domain protein (plasmid) [Streptomyces sp. YIM 121038]|nr:Transposase DDE domain protein [Streptomyces sp. YIM 121038]
MSLTGVNRHDVTQLMPLLDAIPRIRGVRGRPRHRPARLFADRGYDCYRRPLRARGITPKTARRGVAHGSGLGKTRWVVERALCATRRSVRIPVWAVMIFPVSGGLCVM